MAAESDAGGGLLGGARPRLARRGGAIENDGAQDVVVAEGGRGWPRQAAERAGQPQLSRNLADRLCLPVGMAGLVSRVADAFARVQ